MDVRIVAATNRDLSRMVAEGLFRDDLFDRLRFFEIYVPPLRDRMDDIPALSTHFLQQCCKRDECAIDKPRSQACLPGSMKADCATERFYSKLLDYNWPGNIRELQSLVEGARLKHPKEMLCDTHLPRLVRGNHKSASSDDRSLETKMREHIMFVLRQEKGNISRTASALGIPRSSLREKMEKLGIRVL